MSDPASSRRSHIVGAATSIFLRYGFGRTTMADIAQAAGLTRPTLYLTFPDKESVFQAVVEAMIEEKMSQIRTGISDLPTVDRKLLYACNAWAAEGYELVQAHPDARDMFDLGFKSVCAAYQAFEDLIADILRDAVDRSALDLSPAKLARSIVYALKGFKDVATSSADLRTLIATHVAVVSAALSPLSNKDGTRPK
ncbi:MULTISPECIES: TetR/AcrR family transcriptional regulator [Rhizobium]|uniref:TetR/AcrR family transcriptional regulator n=1 Tax=Rhizobium TaxID=379 RepID=UPI00195CE9DD|nr:MULTISPECIES: TetR/AcrR family transcriptional regulator [Rhizobium]MBM7044319.1 TetR/AcrR family transcriptional regulator [Rhizobium lusitanum]